jgi:hypothetical protein
VVPNGAPGSGQAHHGSRFSPYGDEEWQNDSSLLASGSGTQRLGATGRASNPASPGGGTSGDTGDGSGGSGGSAGAGGGGGGTTGGGTSGGGTTGGDGGSSPPPASGPTTVAPVVDPLVAAKEYCAEQFTANGISASDDALTQCGERVIANGRSSVSGLISVLLTTVCAVPATVHQTCSITSIP